MFNKEPQKINPNDSGIDFSKSEKIRKHFKNEKTNLYSEIIPGPVVGDELILYVDSKSCLLYTSPSPRDKRQSRMPSSA